MKTISFGLMATLLASTPAWVAAQGTLPKKAARPAQVEAAGKKEALPSSLEDLFGLDQPPAKPTREPVPSAKDALSGPPPVKDVRAAPAAPAVTELPTEKGLGLPAQPAAEPTPPLSQQAHLPETPPKPPSQESPGTKVQGYLQTELAHTYADPSHWSKLTLRLELGSQGGLGQGVRWKAAARLDYDPIYDLTDFYQTAVRHDQRLELQLREAYLDFTAGGWDWRVGRQHIVWGEMVGLFFADVVSAKDLRQFVLPDFQVLRIPQWAARAEYFRDDFHAELVWIPFPSYDRIGEPRDFSRPGSGADFYPYPVAPADATGYTVLNEDLPGMSLKHGNFGVRLSQLIEGWDLAGFYYNSMDNMATFYREASGTNYVFRPRHERIWQAGGTLAKDLGDFVLKAEAIYTQGRRFNVRRVDDADGVVKQDTLDWIVGFDFNPGEDTRLNTQLFQRVHFGHDPDIVPERIESGVSLLVNHKLPRNWEAEVLLIHSLNRSEWLLRPRLSWAFRRDWRLSAGLDAFGGPPDGLFGRYDHLDRVWAELRRDF